MTDAADDDSLQRAARVGQPYFLNPAGSDDLAHFPPDDPDQWIGVGVEGMSHRLAVKARIAGGRLRVVALRIDDGQVVTSRTLRNVKLGAIEDMLTRELADERQGFEASAQQADEALRRHGPGASDPYRRHLEGRATQTREWLDELQGYIDKLNALPATEASVRSRGRGARPPSEDDYRAFARVYLEQLRTNPRRALSATAKEYGMDRSTVYRWVKECRKPERQYLPPKEDR